jgi:Domain of unknown function (DUF1772)
MTIYLLAVLVLGLMCGSELNVGAFAHRTLNRQPLETHILMRASFARLFGRIMPFWMAASALLNILLLLPFAQLNSQAWRLVALAGAVQVVAILFSLVGPVPINNRIMKWTPQSLPDDWKAQEQRWDAYHLVRTWGLIVAFAALTLGAMLR